jgi:anti-sigma factor (TIGR02949 family)
MKKEFNKSKTIACKQAVARFNDFLDNYLKGEAREELLLHISECKDCMERFEFEQLLKSKLHRLCDSDDTSIKNRIEKLMLSL